MRGRLERQPDILARLTAPERRTVLRSARRLKLRPKDILFLQGNPHEAIYIIESGLIRTYYTSPAGREITLAYWEPGNLVGTPEVFGDSVHMWSGVVVRESQIVELPATKLRSLMMRIPALAIGIVEALVFKGKCFSFVVQMLGTRSVCERLSQLLMILGEHYGSPDPKGGVAIAPQFTHEDLAHMVGASRQWVTMTLDRLQREGVVRVRKRQVVILQPERLGVPGTH